jgi:hypothetical protein
MQGRVRAGGMTPAAAGALVILVADEVGARMAEAAAAPAGLSPSAGAEVLSVASLVGSALAALSSALHDAAARAGVVVEPPAEVEEAVDAVEKLQRELEAALAATARRTAAETEEEAEAAGAVGEGVPALLEELRALAPRVAAVPVPGAAEASAVIEVEGEEEEGEGEGQEEDGEAAMARLLAEMQNDISTRVSESTAALEARAESALASLRERERAAIVLRRGKAIAAAAGGDDGEDGAEAADAADAGDRPSSPVKRLAYAELYLRQLGGRSLGGALPDVTAFMEAVGGADGLAGGTGWLDSWVPVFPLVETVRGAQALGCTSSTHSPERPTNANLTYYVTNQQLQTHESHHQTKGDLELDAEGAAAAAALARLTEEMALIDTVLKLDLGPTTASDLARLSDYLDALEAGPGSPDGAEGDNAESGGSAKAEVAEGVAKAREAIEGLNAQGLVALGLSTSQYRVLAGLREAAAALKGGEADALTYERAVGGLRQAAGQLGEIGAAIQVCGFFGRGGAALFCFGGRGRGC